MTRSRIIVTREESQAASWVDELRQLGLTALPLPLLRFKSLAIPDNFSDEKFPWILFSSPQGVTAFFKAGLSVGRARIGTLGPGTARALDPFGCQDQLGITAKDGKQLATAFIALVPGKPQVTKVLLPGPLQRGPELQDILAEAGFQVTALALYETLPVDPDDLPEDPFQAGDQIFFSSPSAVRAFCGKWQARPPAVAIGETTAALTRQEGFATRVADTPNLQAMVQASGLSPIPSTSNTEMKS